MEIRACGVFLSCGCLHELKMFHWLADGDGIMRRRNDPNAVSRAQPIAALLLLLFLSPQAAAQSDGDSHFSMPVPEIRVLELDTELTFIAPGVAEVLAGRTTEQTWNTVVSSNTDWVLTIRGTEEYWDGPWQKPVSDILCRFDDSEFITLDTEPVEICSGGRVDHAEYPVEFSISLNLLNDIPGEYFYGYVVFELASP